MFDTDISDENGNQSVDATISEKSFKIPCLLAENMMHGYVRGGEAFGNCNSAREAAPSHVSSGKV